MKVYFQLTLVIKFKFFYPVNTGFSFKPKAFSYLGHLSKQTSKFINRAAFETRSYFMSSFCTFKKYLKDHVVKIFFFYRIKSRFCKNWCCINIKNRNTLRQRYNLMQHTEFYYLIYDFGCRFCT